MMTRNITSGTVRLVNLTPHPITLQLVDGAGQHFPVTLPPDGRVPRVEVFRDQVAVLGYTPTPDSYRVLDQAGDPADLIIPVRQTSTGAITGLPDPEPGVLYIVSRMVAEAAPEREDLVFPDELLRDGEGRVVACTSLGRIWRIA